MRERFQTSLPSLQFDHCFNPLLVRRVDKAEVSEAFFAFLGLLGQDVVVKRMFTLELTRPGHFEPFGRSAVGFHLRHILML